MTCLDHIENEYRFTQEGNIVCCDNEHDFITRIATELAELGIKKIYTSAADHADLINSLVLQD
ncbi:MAG: hypothetical protein D3913_01760 [Candidatus Electrothrix sp. LOE1_4_5]|nr:hypothetical protein [Candidatus Electrothrix gigas]